MFRTLISTLVGGILGGGLVWWVMTGSIRLQPSNMTYPELAATLLASVAVLLGILGFIIAILAAIGLSQIKSLARKSATDHINKGLKDGELKLMFERRAVEFLEAQFKQGTLRSLVEARVDFFMHGGIEELVKDESLTNQDE